MEPGLRDATRLQMTDEDFGKLGSFVQKELGIKMPYAKKVMLQCRLQKRVSDLKLNSFKEYLEFIFENDDSGGEMIKMIDLVTTNKTDFFRESAHFDYLRTVVLPEFFTSASGRKNIKVWSAACSSGEEPYTIAIVIAEFLRNFPNADFEVYGTDISLRILQKAVMAVYPEERISALPSEMRMRYFLRSRERADKTVRVVPEIRSKVTFQRMNLMDNYYNTDREFDIVFCRNVLIYFDRETQESVINKLVSNLKRDGYFFLGHSESISNMKVPLRQLKPTVFRKI